MCFMIDEKYPFELVAEEDIVCYKKMDLFRDAEGTIYLKSPLYNYKQTGSVITMVDYFLNKQYQATDKEQNCVQDLIVGKSTMVGPGFHSYKAIDDESIFVKKYVSIGMFFSGNFIKCIIPKGTKYMMNSCECYVSTHIKFVEIVKE